ncbi:hypothetical protein PFISCL1PPCAC_17748, partial [Pristionchus fissidentatus]
WSFVNFEKICVRVSFERKDLKLNETVDIGDHHEFTRKIGSRKTGNEDIYAFLRINCSTIHWNTRIS